MGLFDSLHVDEKIIKNNDLKFKCCGKSVKTYEWQTKDIQEPSMSNFYLTYERIIHPLLFDPNYGNLKLFKLGPPSKDSKFFTEYTDYEINEYNKKWVVFMQRKKGDGEYKTEAFLPENRKQFDTGALPHKYINIYQTCYDCGLEKENTWFDLYIKFTNGIGVFVDKIPGELPGDMFE